MVFSCMDPLPVSFKLPGCTLQRCRQYRQLLPHPLRITLVESFVHSRNHHGGITGVFARSINHMAKPRPVRQSIGDKQSPLGFAQCRIQLFQFGWIVGRIFLLRRNLDASLFKVPSRG